MAGSEPTTVEPGAPWRRAGEDGRALGLRPAGLVRSRRRGAPGDPRNGSASSTCRRSASSLVEGPGATALLDRIVANRLPAVGRIAYSQLLDSRGGILGDVTIARLADDAYRVVTGSAAAASDLGRLLAHRRIDVDGDATLRDSSDAFACIGLWGPRARDVLAGASSSDVGDAAMPIRSILPVRVGPVQAFGARGSATPASWAGSSICAGTRRSQAWDALVDAGTAHGIRQVGYRAIESLRLEKGYRAYGTDLTASDTPDEAGLAMFVRPEKGPFIGREAILERRTRPLGRRLRTLLIGPDDRWQPVYGGEAVLEGIGGPVDRTDCGAPGSATPSSARSGSRTSRPRPARERRSRSMSLASMSRRSSHPASSTTRMAPASAPDAPACQSMRG